MSDPTVETVEEMVRHTDNVVELLRENTESFSLGERFPAVPNEVTNWRDEQRAIIESCVLGDLSHHMTTVHAEGPDTLQLLKKLSVNDLDSLDVGQAKHLVMCGPGGHIIGDGPLLRLGREEFWLVPAGAENWLRYHLETGDYRVTAEFDPPTAGENRDPETFIYQVQGPTAFDTLEELTDASLRDIDFYTFEEITLAGRPVRAFGHGMSAEPGFEFHGPYEYADEIKDAILEAGERHDIRHLGSKAYNTQSVRLGWIEAGPPPIYDDDGMRDFREWLDADSREGTFSIEGSFDSDDIAEYYMSPVEYGFEPLVDLDHDFVGKGAIREEMADPEREFVSLLWDDDDVIDVYASLFRGDEQCKFFDLPRHRVARSAFDEVLVDGELAGLSRRRSYQPDIEGIASLGIVDTDYSEPGTEVTVVWGEGSDSPNPRIEDHTVTEISAEVAPVPYTEDLRKSTTSS